MKVRIDPNNQDDWLKEELERESKVSFWDLDEGKKLRNEHLEDCEVKELADSHHRKHLRSQENNLQQVSRSIGNRRRTTGLDVACFIAAFLMIFVLTGLNAYLFHSPFVLPTIILFLGINPGIFVWLLLFRRFPAAWYSITLIIIAIALEIYQFIGYSLRIY
ncbi:MAG: hypothetical protein IJI44_02235 [Erysipelotrichaceae bacterium]|nr:hypothetical protein [Erysipelotrichaceae bacterium]